MNVYGRFGMILAIDIGNSSVSCGIFQMHPAAELAVNGMECVCRFKIAAKHLTADEYMLLFCQFLSMYRISPAETCSVFHRDTGNASDNTGVLDACVIASVVPELTETIAKVARQLTGAQPLLIGQGVRTGFGIKIRNPEQLGADIVANIAGALLYAEPPLIVLDVGTATTITYVNCNKDIIGTIIIPGLTVSMAALTDSAALLSDVPLERPQELLGKTTSESIRSGVIGGHTLMIDGFLRNIREQYAAENGDAKIGLIASGGLAEAILPCCRNKFRYVADLTLQGAVSLYMKNGPGKRL